MTLGRLWRAWVWRVTRPKIELIVHRIECPYDELEMSRRYPWRELTMPARLLLCEGYNRINGSPFPSDDIHEDAHDTAMALACGDIE